MGVEQQLDDLGIKMAQLQVQNGVVIQLAKHTAELLNTHIANHTSQSDALVKIQKDMDKLKPALVGIRMGGWAAKHWKPIVSLLVTVVGFFGYKRVI